MSWVISDGIMIMTTYNLILTLTVIDILTFESSELESAPSQVSRQAPSRALEADQPENGRRQVRQSDHAADCSNKLPTFIAQVLEKSQGLSLSLV